jgi:hypothetical protein
MNKYVFDAQVPGHFHGIIHAVIIYQDNFVHYIQRNFAVGSVQSTGRIIGGQNHNQFHGLGI